MKRQLENNYLELLNKHRAIIYAVCWRYGEGNEERVKELYSEVAMALWIEYKRFEKSRFGKRCSESTWIYQLAQNTIAYYLRQQRHQEGNPLLLSKNEMEMMAIATEEVNVVIRREDNYGYVLMNLIQQLNDIDQRIVLYYLDECSYTEIARLMGMSETALGTRMSRILQRLKELNKQASK